MDRDNDGTDKDVTFQYVMSPAFGEKIGEIWDALELDYRQDSWIDGDMVMEVTGHIDAVTEFLVSDGRTQEEIDDMVSPTT